jgi:hypothetical protein
MARQIVFPGEAYLVYGALLALEEMVRDCIWTGLNWWWRVWYVMECKGMERKHTQYLSPLFLVQ